MKITIPPISDADLAERAARIRPVVRFRIDVAALPTIKPVDRSHNGVPFWIREREDWRSVSYIWEPVPTEIAQDIEPIGNLITYHTCGAPSFFKPSVAEVLAQIPPSLLGRAVAFEIADDENMGIRNVCPSGGHHWVATIVYGRRSES